MRYVLDFKTGKLPSYSSVTKLQRISSIESIQSLMMDKANESGIRSLSSNESKIKNKSKRFNFVPKTTHIQQSQPFYFSRRIDGLENTVGMGSSGGYFCN